MWIANISALSIKMSLDQLTEQIRHFAGLAVHFDRLGNFEAAAYYYMQTSFLIDSAPNQEELKLFRDKAVVYKKRAEELLSMPSKVPDTALQEKVST